MKRAIQTLSVVGVLLLGPATAEGAVVLDPGTRLTVVCKKPARFQVVDFTSVAPRRYTPVQDLDHPHRRRVVGFGYVIGEDPPLAFEEENRVTIRRRGSVRRLNVKGQSPVTWRGC